MGKQDKTRYMKDRHIRSYPPKYCKEILIGMAAYHERSISHISGIALQKYVDSLPENQRQEYINKYNSLSPDQRRYPKSGNSF